MTSPLHVHENTGCESAKDDDCIKVRKFTDQKSPIERVELENTENLSEFVAYHPLKHDRIHNLRI